MKAKKENKVYRINTEQEKKRYLKEGYDIYDEEGVLVEHSPLKKVAYSEYAKLQSVNAALLAENGVLRAKVDELEAAAVAMAEEATDKKSK